MFQRKGWIVHHFRDLRARAVRKCVNKLAETRGDIDCVMVILASHGTFKAPYGSDGHEIDVQKSIYEPLDDTHCSPLKGLPKIFFIQSCREKISTFGK